MNEHDIWGTAKMMRIVYGARASGTACLRARKAYGNGDLAAYFRWTEIARIVGAVFGEPSVAAGPQQP